MTLKGIQMRFDISTLGKLADDLSEYKDDVELFWDTLEGETDVMDLVGSVIKQVNETDANIVACKHLINTYSDRRNTLEGRRVALTKVLRTILVRTDQSKIPHALATVYLRNGVESLNITNPEEMPTQLMKVTSAPDRTEIKKQLKAGVQIEGAELVTGAQTISIRMK